MNYSRIYLLDIQSRPDLFSAAHIGPHDAASYLVKAWHNESRAWNRSYTIFSNSLAEVFKLANTTQVHWRNLSVGDVIEISQHCYLVAPTGFIEIGRPKDACPHAATLKPSACEFCAYGDDLEDLPF
jgi:hypothetical protein